MGDLDDKVVIGRRPQRYCWAATRVCILAYAPEGCLCGLFEQNSLPLSISLTVSVVPNMILRRRLHHARATTFEQSTFTNVDEENIIGLIKTN
ncbi:hypothetical protein H9L39_16886 [Fusarium oxysporum f. sp. albedinis]|nr:hypothetical protein H9L39_16886 [Fusarium oxysporum f. sp. albedinis]